MPGFRHGDRIHPSLIAKLLTVTCGEIADEIGEEFPEDLRDEELGSYLEKVLDELARAALFFGRACKLTRAGREQKERLLGKMKASIETYFDFSYVVCSEGKEVIGRQKHHGSAVEDLKQRATKHGFDTGFVESVGRNKNYLEILCEFAELRIQKEKLDPRPKSLSSSKPKRVPVDEIASSNLDLKKLPSASFPEGAGRERIKPVEIPQELDAVNEIEGGLEGSDEKIESPPKGMFRTGPPVHSHVLDVLETEDDPVDDWATSFLELEDGPESEGVSSAQEPLEDEGLEDLFRTADKPNNGKLQSSSEISLTPMDFSSLSHEDLLERSKASRELLRVSSSETLGSIPSALDPDALFAMAENLGSPWEDEEDDDRALNLLLKATKRPDPFVPDDD